MVTAIQRERLRRHASITSTTMTTPSAISTGRTSEAPTQRSLSRSVSWMT